MKRLVNMHAAKTGLSELIKRAAAGDEIIIARDGLPVARLVPIAQAPAHRQFGAFAGKLHVPPAFFEPLPPEELGSWER